METEDNIARGLQGAKLRQRNILQVKHMNISARRVSDKYRKRLRDL